MKVYVNKHARTHTTAIVCDVANDAELLVIAEQLI